MKLKFLLGLFAGLLLVTSFTTISDKGSAKAEQQQGLYIFMFSKPTTEYEYLGSVKKGMALTGQPEEMLNSMIKKVKKEYPKAEGIVFTSVAMDKADAIQFKDK